MYSVEGRLMNKFRVDARGTVRVSQKRRRCSSGKKLFQNVGAGGVGVRTELDDGDAFSSVELGEDNKAVGIGRRMYHASTTQPSAMTAGTTAAM